MDALDGEANSTSRPVSVVPGENPEDTRGHIVPSKDLLLSLCSQGRSKETQEKLLAKQTHVNLNNKGLTKIANLRGCTGLRVLYLYDNKIATIENLDFANKLTHLYLQNNEIGMLENLGHHKSLQKLYLDGNRIAVVEGLDACQRLEELHINRQLLPLDGPGLQFDQMCMYNLSHSLCVLQAADCGVCDDALEMLALLKVLEDCKLSNNRVARVEYVQMLVAECGALRTLDLRGCPVVKLPKYRNNVIIHSERLLSLDDKSVTSQEREFLLRLQVHKSKSIKKKAPLKDTGAGDHSLPLRFMNGQENKVNGQFALGASACTRMPSQNRSTAQSTGFDHLQTSEQPSTKREPTLSKTTLQLDLGLGPVREAH
eukprot:CAMPEP_0114245390 /NCGR_PEP_ID=MMETSP0058-20121206/11868_1 /TAXON_ID=36894 /ORGANISM="Pyramimonas parkeae, CCMP726" /LENGTH=370 /DNA_ID=CAMNT_0001358435 /DNA_START=153 /DNA_END=1265 /DNA_ORIENTATION=+